MSQHTGQGLPVEGSERRQSKPPKPAWGWSLKSEHLHGPPLPHSCLELESVPITVIENSKLDFACKEDHSGTSLPGFWPLIFPNQLRFYFTKISYKEMDLLDLTRKQRQTWKGTEMTSL